MKKEVSIEEIALTFINGNISDTRKLCMTTEIKNYVYDYLIENGMKEEADFFRKCIYK